MDVSVYSDPVKVGPGIWFKIHTDAVVAVTDSLKHAFIVNINYLCDNFKCKKCQPHFRKFIDTHPLENYFNIRDDKGRDIGVFKWTWEMHNQVNRFLKKYEPTLEEAYEYFANNEAGACFNCGGEPYTSRHLHPIITPIASDRVNSERLNSLEGSIPEQRSRAIPPILSLYRESVDVNPQPFRLIPRNG